MEVGNELYSQWTGQVYSMQTELPAVIARSEKNYQLHYSESYTGNLYNSDSIIELTFVLSRGLCKTHERLIINSDKKHVYEAKASRSID